jgi:hypothetical protein
LSPNFFIDNSLHETFMFISTTAVIFSLRDKDSCKVHFQAASFYKRYSYQHYGTKAYWLVEVLLHTFYNGTDEDE